MSRFTSGFSAKLDAYLEYYAARGFKEASHIRYLLKFDRYCAEHFPEQSTLTREAVHHWLDSVKTTANEFARYATVIRQFGIYLCAVDGTAYVLPEKFAPNQSEFNPYIFTDEELAALFKAIDALPPFKDEPHLNEISPVMFRLIYTCGLRPNEGRELLAKNIDIKTGNILITGTKRNTKRSTKRGFRQAAPSITLSTGG
jgi:integrase